MIDINQVNPTIIKTIQLFVLEWLVRILNRCMREERRPVLFLCLKTKGIALDELTIGG